MRPKPAQLSVIAVAALGIVAVAAAMLLAGGNPAQATSAETVALNDNGDGIHLRPVQQVIPSTPTPTPVQPTPEPCSPYPDHVFNTGHLAMFEAYWDASRETLVNNPCPAKLRHVPPTPPATEETHERTATGANIGSTIFHASSSYKGELVAAGTATNEAMKKWSLGDYPFLAEGASAGDPIWVMPECPEDRAPASGQLCLGFSAGLLHPYYWKGDLQYEFEYEDESEGISAPDRGDVFVFYGHDDVPEGEDQLDWKTTDLDANELLVTPGDYTHRYWAFTKPGTYRFEVHAKGHPKDTLKSQMTRTDRNYLKTITSEVRTYTIHVGLLADLGVEVDAPDTAVNPGEDVTISFTARNGDGSDTATNTKVGITLPDGLPYRSHDTATGTYDPVTGIWTVGDLLESDVAFLTITVRVAEGTRGTEQKVKAAIFATEQIGTSDVVELDPLTDDNMAMDTVTIRSIPNSDSFFRVMRSVAENQPTGATVGDPIMAAHDADGDTLDYWLTGPGHENFEVDKSTRQIRVSMCGNLDHETKSSYDLKLNVGDKKDPHSNRDVAADHYLGVQVKVTDVDDTIHPAPSAGIAIDHNPKWDTYSSGYSVDFTATPKNLLECAENLRYTWEFRYVAPRATTWTVVKEGAENSLGRAHSDAVTVEYRVKLSYTNAAGETVTLTSQALRLNWS